jgi:hypothetical protein
MLAASDIAVGGARCLDATCAPMSAATTTPMARIAGATPIHVAATAMRRTSNAATARDERIARRGSDRPWRIPIAES